MACNTTWAVRALLISTLMVMGALGPAVAQFRTVTVQNAPTNPVPVVPQGSTAVTGTVNIGNSPSVNVSNTPAVTITGTPTINLNGPQPVKSANAPTTTINGQTVAPLVTRSIDDQVRNGMQTNTLSVGAGLACVYNSASSCSGSVTVPAGKKLVIEYVNVFSNGFGGADVNYFTLSTVAGGTASVYYFSRGDPLPGGSEYIASQPARIYADPGSTVTFTGYQTTSSGNGEFLVTVSGYYASVP